MAVSEYYKVPRKLISMDLTQIGGSSLTDSIPVESRGIDEIEDHIPTSYVPARNSIFISLAAAYLETIGGNAIYVGVNAMDYSGYPDCRPEYIHSLEEALNLGTGDGNNKWMSINAPLQYLTKSEIIKMGMKLGVPYELTWSCYNGGKQACGRCDSCQLRLKGFADSGFQDPIPYEFYPAFYRGSLDKP